MGANVHVIEGATEIELYFRNYTYATALSDLNNLENVFFTDLDRFGYKAWSGTPKAGSLRKFLEDASGSSNIPDESVLFANSDGRATFDSDFSFDGTDLLVPGGTVLAISDSGEIPLANGFSLVVTATGIDIYKDDSYTGVSLI
jgi:hypothetical protein